MTNAHVLKAAAALAAAVVLFKFLYIYVDSGFDLAVVPWGLLLVLAVPFLVVVAVASRHRRAAAWLMLPFSLAGLTWMAVGLSRFWFGADLSGGDVTFASLAAAAFALGTVAAVRTLAVGERAAVH